MSLAADVKSALAWLKAHSSARTREGMARYAIPSGNALGVTVGDMRRLAKGLGRNQKLAEALWKTRVYEARMLACLIGDPATITAATMDRWTRDFDSWAICDTACFCLFDRTPLAWKKIAQWSRRPAEFEKRAAFALLASVSLHDKKADDAKFLQALPLIARASTDERNFVKKGVSWALRGVGRRNPRLKKAALKMARDLAKSQDGTARWIGKDALRDLERK